MIKLPKYIVNELENIRTCANKMNTSLSKFEEWIFENVDDEFDISLLRAMGNVYPHEQTEALSDIEHGCVPDVKDIERVLNLYLSKKQTKA